MELRNTIERGRHKRLLLVQAPAGYGKSMLLTQWHKYLIAAGARAAWIGLEKADAQPGRFSACIVSALSQAGLEIPASLHEAARDGDPADLLEALIRCGEQYSRETWLVIEDWHLINASPATELLEAMLRRMPVNWHIALSSRQRPKFNLIALRAAGQLVEIGPNELRFSRKEIEALMTPAHWPATAIAELAEVTEGWAIALQLAQLWATDKEMLSTLKRSFLGSIEGMADYVAAEIFAEMTAELQQFLLESSVCNRLNAGLADAVRQRSDSARFIEELKASLGLLIPLDEAHEWYRMSRIFCEFLEGQRQSISPKRLAQLHGRAADWYESQGLLFEAVEQASRSGNQGRTISLIENAGCVDLCIRTDAPAVRSLLDAIPTEVVHQRPRLRAAHTAINLKLGSIAEASKALAELQATLGSDSVDSALQRDLLIVESLRQCFIDKSPSTEELIAYRRSLENFAGSDWWLEGLMHNVQGRLEMRRGLLTDAVASLSRADQIFVQGGATQGHFFMLANLAICYLLLGRLSAADEALKLVRAVFKGELDRASAYAGVAQAVEALFLYERNELSAAGNAAQLALAGLERAEGCFEQYFISTYAAVRAAFATSGYEAAMRMIERGRRLSLYHGLPRLERLVDCLQARLHIDAEQWDEAEKMAPSIQGLTIEAADGGWLELDFWAPVHALLALHHGRLDEARDMARLMIERCLEGGRVSAQIRAYILMALACDAAQNSLGKFAALEDAISLAAIDGIVQPFFEFGPRILGLLRDFQRSEMAGMSATQANFVSGLVLRIIAAGKADSGAEQLTQREREVLAHLRDGVSNKVIARALDLTENAVKFHFKNIFRKLGINNRAMAAAIANRISY